jgi:hypothetical protein
MARLIQITTIPSSLKVVVGDVLQFAASGGRVADGDPDVVQLIGTFLRGTATPSGQVISPQGPPSTVLFRAQQEGRAIIHVMSGDPFRSAKKTDVEIVVEQRR